MPKPSPQAQLNVFINRFTPEIAERARAAIKSMRFLVPGAIEMVYDNYNALVVGFGPTERPSEAIFSVVIYPQRVSLCFLQGAKLPNPNRLLQGDGNQVRYIRLTRGEVLDEPDVRAMIELAMDRAPKPFDAGGKRKLIIKSISAKQRPRRPK
jgi:hypothetical protein